MVIDKLNLVFDIENIFNTLRNTTEIDDDLKKKFISFYKGNLDIKTREYTYYAGSKVVVHYAHDKDSVVSFIYDREKGFSINCNSITLFTQPLENGIPKTKDVERHLLSLFRSLTGEEKRGFLNFYRSLLEKIVSENGYTLNEEEDLKLNIKENKAINIISGGVHTFVDDNVRSILMLEASPVKFKITHSLSGKENNILEVVIELSNDSFTIKEVCNFYIDNKKDELRLHNFKIESAANDVKNVIIKLLEVSNFYKEGKND